MKEKVVINADSNNNPVIDAATSDVTRVQQILAKTKVQI